MLRYAVTECPEYCITSTSRVCLDCPQNKRSYLYCTLHELHSSHANQSCPRRKNVIVENNTTVLVTSTTNTTTVDSGISNNSLVMTGGGRARKKRSADLEELCMCGCNRMHDGTSMNDCRGIGCRNKINRTCVPNTWLCSLCKHNV